MSQPMGAMGGPRPGPLARPSRLGLEGFARSAGLHPDLVRRLVALGLLRATRDAGGQLWLSPAELVTVARIQRLRAGLSLNYAAVGLVLDLLDRIDALERALRVRSAGAPRSDDPPWTSTA